MADERTPDDAPQSANRRSRAAKAAPAHEADAELTSPLPAVVPLDEDDAVPSDTPTQTMPPVPAEPEPEPEPDLPTPGLPAEPAPQPQPEPEQTHTRTQPRQQPDATPYPVRQPRPVPPYATAPTGPAVNPFTGVPAWDYVRDVVAATLLLVALSQQWDAAHDASDRVDVVLITVLSVFSLAVAYLARLGALGSGWDLGRIPLVRFLLNVPYLVMVLVYLVIDVVKGGDLGLDGGGIGVGLGLGLAGALLAAQPREAETDRVGGPWLWGLAGLGSVITIGTVMGLVTTLVRSDDGIRTSTIIWALLLTLVTAVLVLAPIAGAVVRDASWRLVLLGLGSSAAVLLLGADDSHLPGLKVESFHGLGFGYILWPAAAAIAAAPVVRRAMLDHGPRARWIGAAVQLSTVVVGAALLWAGVRVVQLADGVGLEDQRGTLITSLVLSVLVALGALIARSALAQNQPQGRAVTVVVASALLLLGLVHLAVLAADDVLEVGLLDQVLALAVPVALAVMVGVPSLREASARNAAAAPTTSLRSPR